MSAAERGKAPRDVLAERIATWAGEESVYDYADRLIRDLDAAGFDVMPANCHTCGSELGAFCSEHGYVMWGAEKDENGKEVAGPARGRMQWAEGSLIHDIASVLTVYDEHVPAENRGPWRDRLQAWIEFETL